MKMKALRSIHVLVGLPGSGKTTWAETNFRRRYYEDGDIVSFDEIHQNLNLLNSKDIKSMIHSQIGFKENIILDGLFPKQDDIIWVLKNTLEILSDARYYVQQIVIDRWTDNIDDCLWNDRGRRTKSSERTIKTLKIEDVDIEAIATAIGQKVKLVKHKVVRKPEYDIFFHENNVLVSNKKYLYSETWSLGGQNFDWEGNLCSTIRPETPKEFCELDELLSKIAPNITFLQYKRISNECCTIEDRDGNDYYSIERLAYHCCDLEKLYAILRELNIIPEIK